MLKFHFSTPENSGKIKPMFTVTETARKSLADFFKGKEQKQIRIALTHSCGGMQIAMRIDEQKDNDIVY